MLKNLSDRFHKKSLTVWIPSVLYVANILHLSFANPRLCNKEYDNKTFVATLHTSLDVSICVLANVSKANFPLLKINDKWVSLNDTSSSIIFSWKLISTTAQQYNLTLHFKNVTVYDYGSMTVRILTNENNGMDYSLTINPPGNYEMTFEHCKNEHDEIKCEANWFPKLIQIEYLFGGSGLQITNNSLKQTERRNAIASFVGRDKCSLTGIFVCIVTSFKDKIYKRNLARSNDQCPITFCMMGDHADIQVSAVVKRSVTFGICLNNVVFEPNVSINITSINSNTANLLKFTNQNFIHDKLLYINITVKDILESNNGTHRIEITVFKDNKPNKLYKNVVIRVYRSVELCNEYDKDKKINITLGSNVTVETCIQDKSNNLRSLIINKTPVKLKESTVNNERHVYIKPKNADSYYIGIKIITFSEKTPSKYEVKLTTLRNDEISYKFELVLHGFLHLCENDTDQKAVEAKLYKSLFIHVCYKTDFHQIDHVGINNAIYQINKSVLRNDIEVSVDQSDIIDNKKQYFMQIYLRSVSRASYKNYTLQIKHISNVTLHHSFEIKEQEFVADVFGCESEKPKMYYYTKSSRNVTICRRLRMNNSLNWTVNNLTYRFFGLNSPNRLQNIQVDFNNSNILINIISVSIYNFGRYDFSILLQGKYTVAFIFYLIRSQDLPNSLCENGTTNTTIMTNGNGTQSFCFEIFGQVDKSIHINKKVFPISGETSQTNGIPITKDNLNSITVQRKWNTTLKRRFIQVTLLPTKSMNLTIELDSIDRNFTFYIIKNSTMPDSMIGKTPSCVIHQNRSFTAVSGEEINITLCESIYFTKNLFVFFNDHPVISSPYTNKSYMIVHSSSRTDSKKLILRLTNLTSHDMGNSTIIIMLDDLFNFSTTILLAQSDPAGTPAVTADITYIIYTVPLVAIVLCLAVLLLYILRKKSWRKRCCGNLTQKFEAINHSHRDEGGIYVNVKDLQENEYINLQLQRPQVTVSMANPPDLTRDLGPHIYSNSRDDEQDTSTTSLEHTAHNSLISGRYISEEGLVYVTISHANSLRSSASSRSTPHSDSVVYASLDMEKTGMLPLLQHGDSKHRRKKVKKITSKT